VKTLGPDWSYQPAAASKEQSFLQRRHPGNGWHCIRTTGGLAVVSGLRPGSICGLWKANVRLPAWALSWLLGE